MHLIITIDLLSDHKTLNQKKLEIIKGAGSVYRPTSVHSYNSLRDCLAPQNDPLNLNSNAWQKHHSDYYSSFLNTHQAVACSGAKAVKVSNSEKH